MSIFEIIVFSLVFSFIGFYSIYFLICLIYSRLPARISHSVFNDAQLPVVSFIVPVYNECKMIESRITNFNQIDYPAGKLEVVIVDGGSEDGTLDILEDFKRKVNFIVPVSTAQNVAESSVGSLKVVEGINGTQDNIAKAESRGINFSLKIVKQGSRKGFNAAVIEGFHNTTGEIIFITGAETQYAPNAVKLLVNHFADPEVGAVNGTVRFSNADAGVSPKIEKAYRTFYDFLRDAESKMDTPFDIKGEIAAARRSICQKLVNEPRMLKKGCIDACFSFQAKLDGLKTVYDPAAFYLEPAPRSLPESFKQQTRRAATLIQNLFLFKSIMLNSKYGLFGLLTMPAHFMMLIVLPYIFLLSLVGIVLLVAINPFNLIAISLLILGFTGTIFLQEIRAFFKVQLALITATFKMVTGVETQKFERLSSVRPL